MRPFSVPFPRFLPAALLAIAAVTMTPPADATSGAPFMAEPGRGYTMPVRTIKEVRLQAAFRTTIHQQYDFSCGSAAIASLLT